MPRFRMGREAGRPDQKKAEGSTSKDGENRAPTLGALDMLPAVRPCKPTRPRCAVRTIRGELKAGRCPAWLKLRARSVLQRDVDTERSAGRRLPAGAAKGPCVGAGSMAC